MFIGRWPVAPTPPNQWNVGMPDAATPDTIALVRDLIFSSRIRATAKDLGVEIRMIRDPRHALAAGGSRLLVDLNQDGAIDAAQAWRAATGGVAIGFVSHVDVETVNRAR